MKKGPVAKKKRDTNLHKRIVKNQNPGILFEPFCPKKVPGFVHYFFRELFCDRPFLFAFTPN